MYYIDPASYGSVFVLPRSITDDLILASGAYLKVLLLAFARTGEPLDAEAVSKATGLNTDDAADALRYWAQRGYLRDEDAAPAAEAPANRTPAPAPEPPTEPEKKPKEAIDLKPSKPSYEMICKRMGEDAAVRELFSEAQMKLGRTIGTADQATLLLLYDYYGLPAEVILAICEYARIHKKERNMGYIYTVGVDWSRREIDTLEAADAELKLLEGMNAAWKTFATAAKLPNANPTAAQQKYIVKWTSDWKFTQEMLLLAYEQTLNNAGKASFPYMDKILAAWKSEGTDTPEKAAEREKRHREDTLAKAAEQQAARAKGTPRKKNADPQNPPSYDIDRFEQRMKTTVPKLKKKEKR